jgi:hypothetical protein
MNLTKQICPESHQTDMPIFIASKEGTPMLSDLFYFKADLF